MKVRLLSAYSAVIPAECLNSGLVTVFSGQQLTVRYFVLIAFGIPYFLQTGRTTLTFAVNKVKPVIGVKYALPVKEISRSFQIGNPVQVVTYRQWVPLTQCFRALSLLGLLRRRLIAFMIDSS